MSLPALLLAILSVLASTQAAASPAAPQERAGEEPFEGHSDVVLVQVPVHVTDRDGEPVRDLPPEAFRLWDDGREIETIQVETVDHAHLAADASKATDTSEPTDPDDLPAAARRKVLLLFDLSFSRPASVVRARSAALDFVLHDLGPGDLAAVATVSVEQGARLLVTFTRDRAQLARAVDTLGQPGLTGPASGDPLRFVLERPPSRQSTAGEGGRRERFDRELEEQLDLFRAQRRRVEQNFERGRIADWTRSLAHLAGSLAGLQGDQHVVVFSEGFDSRLVFGDAPAADPSRGAAGRPTGSLWRTDADETFGSSTLQSAVADMARVFRRAGVRLHAVDVGGLRTGARADETSAGEAAPRGGRDSLFFVADATGGELLRDANDLSAGLERLLRQSSVTYLLSFYPRDLPDDGSYRPLRVAVEGLPRGARVRHREGYFAPRPFAELPPLERALLTSETLTAPRPKQDLELHLLATTFRAGDGRSYVPLILELPSASLLRPTDDESGEEDHAEQRLEIFVYAGDADGTIRDFATQPLRASRRALGEHRGLKFYTHLLLPPGPHQLRVLVRDPADGRTTVHTRTLQVPDWSGPVLLPPLAVQRPDEPWLMVRQDAPSASPQEDDGTVVYPFLRGREPYVPAAVPRLRVGESLPVVLVGYGFSGSGPEASGPDGWTGAVVGDEGVAHLRGPLAELLADVTPQPTRVEGQTQLSGRLVPAGLRPGRYVLEITTPEGAASAMAFQVVP